MSNARGVILSVLSSIIVAIAICVVALPRAASASGNWPSQPIKIIVPFAPGGSNDIIVRLLAQKLGERLHNPVVVENRGGAGGTIGTTYVAKAQPDGYTLLFASTSITTNFASDKTLPYDLEKDFVPIGAVATSPFAVVVSNDLPVKTLSEFIAYAKAHPGAISYGTAGVGGINHMGTELLAHAAGIELTHVPYKGIAPAFVDLLGGNLQMLLPSVASSVQYIRDGRMRGLAVTGAHRSDMLPELPVASEAGIPGFQLEVWYGLLAPAGTPDAIVQRMNQELSAVLASDDIKKQLAVEGAAPLSETPRAFGERVHQDIQRWRGLIETAGLQINK